MTAFNQNMLTIDTSKSITQKIHLEAFEKKQIEVYIKRDDLIHPVISGNKWRKLKYLIKHAQENHFNTLVSFGGAYSNHLPALALAAKLHHLKSVAFVRGNELNIESNEKLKFCHDCGMQMHFVDRNEYKDKPKLFNDNYNTAEFLFVDEGGKSIYALGGCAEIVEEIELDAQHILLPVGTGTTLAGVALGCNDLRPHAKIYGIVVLKGAEYLNDEVASLVPNLRNYELLHEYHQGGYAKTNAYLEEAIRNFYKDTQIKTEPIYSGKMIAAAYQMLEQGLFKAGEQVVLVHTGGIWLHTTDKKF
ncbi:MAG: pyridoxal-phosphate dependent enzyme [Bacteroidetes bacterium]|nr:pyridoxal-phosphate dependent enzyme [Bacteroidota bacterium]